MGKKNNYLKILLGTFLFFKTVTSCFLVHFVFYGPIEDWDYNRFVNIDYPYIFHLNQSIKLPNNKTLDRVLTPIEQSDVKKMQVIYHHGGLYLDNDHVIQIQCIKKFFCGLSKGFFLLNWMDRGLDSWYKSVPISFIYSTQPKNPTIYKILTSYNQSIKQTIHFSGPFHAQNYRNQVSFVVVNKSCQFHLGIQSWNKDKNPEFYWLRKKFKKIANKNTNLTQAELEIQKKQQQKRKVFEDAKKKQLQVEKQFYIKLWKSHCVIYPTNFNYNTFIPFDGYFNHVQVTNKQNQQFVVKKYSDIPQTRKKLQQVVLYYKNRPMSEIKKNQDIIAEYREYFEKKQKITKNKQLLNQKLETNSFIGKLKQSSFFVTITNIIFALMTVIFLQKIIKQILNSKKKTAFNLVSASEKKNQQQNLLQNQYSVSIAGLKLNKHLVLFMLLYIFVSITFFGIHRDASNQNLNKFLQVVSERATKAIEQEFKEQRKGTALENLWQKKFTNPQYKITYWKNPQRKYPYEITIQDMGIDKYLQIGSKYDFLIIDKRVQFEIFKQNYLKDIEFKSYQFKKDSNYQNSQKLKQPIKFTQLFTQLQLQTGLKNLQQQYNNKFGSFNKTINADGEDLSISNLMLYHNLYNNPYSQRFKQLQYYNLQKNYHLDESLQEKQIPLCILSAGFNITKRSNQNYQKFLYSIGQQNYTNYHIVFIDDGSQDGSFKQIASFISMNSQKPAIKNIKNKIRMVKNKQRLGKLASLYIFGKMYCHQRDVVLIVNPQDSLIGNQVFKVINTVYNDQNVWFAHSASLFYDINIKQNYQIQKSKYGQFDQDQIVLIPNYSSTSNKLSVNVSQYRTSKQWNTSSLQTFRKFLLQRIPFQALIQYEYDENPNTYSNTLRPRFYPQGAEYYLIYPILELCGDQRIRFIKQPLYFLEANAVPIACQQQHLKYLIFQARVKKMLAPLPNKNSQTQYLPYTDYKQRFLITFRDYYNGYNKCYSIYFMQKNLK